MGALTVLGMINPEITFHNGKKADETTAEMVLLGVMATIIMPWKVKYKKVKYMKKKYQKNLLTVQ